VSDDGTVTGGAEGRVTIKATIGTISARAALTVQPRPVAAAGEPPAPVQREETAPPPPPPVPEPILEPEPKPAPAPVLKAIVLEPEKDSLPEGTARRFTAWGRYSDGTVRDITREAVWASSDVQVAHASLDGSVIGIRFGTATIAATLQSYSGAAAITVTPVVARIAVRPAELSLRHRARRRLDVVAILTDESRHDITDQVTWTSSDENVASVRDGEIEAIGPGTATITAAFDDFRAFVPVKVEPVVESVTIQPRVSSLAVGQLQPLIATARLSDGTTRDVTLTANWSCDSPAIRISPSGMITAVAPGVAVVTVRVDSAEGEARVEVTRPPS